MQVFIVYARVRGPFYSWRVNYGVLTTTGIKRPAPTLQLRRRPRELRGLVTQVKKGKKEKKQNSNSRSAESMHSYDYTSKVLCV